jgi:cytochrome bd-type quinol oxidase subunit 1
MLSKQEEAFITFWEKNRNKQRKLHYQLAVGLPVGLLIGAVIVVNFYAGWYKRAEMVANSRFSPLVLYFAVLLIAVFFAVFSKKFQWDRRETIYRELILKKRHSEQTPAANIETDESCHTNSNIEIKL